MFEGNTYQLILGRMLSRVSDKFDKREGSIIFDTHSPTALEFQFLYIELERMIQEAYGDTASRDYLILRCKERGIYPHAATKAVLRGIFTPDGLVSAGQRFNIGDMNFTFTGEEVEDGQGGYKVECETPGIIGNQYFGTMIPIDYIEGLETAELTEVLIPGEDEEDTEDLRKRYFDSFGAEAFGGNVRDYLEKTNAIPGVGSTKVIRVWNSDIRPAEMVPSAAIQAWYESIKPTLAGQPAEWLETVYRAAEQKKLTVGGTVRLVILNSDFDLATETLIQTVQETIDPAETAGEGYGLAPIGHVVSVQSAQGVLVAVKTNLTFDVGYGWANLQTAIDDAISAYLLELRKEWVDAPYLVVRISQIETRILAIKGVVDITKTRLNGVEDNLILGKYQVPLFGGAGA